MVKNEVVCLPKRVCPIQKFITQYIQQATFFVLLTNFSANTSNFDSLYYVHWIDACDFMILSLELSVFFVLLSNFWLVVVATACSIHQFMHNIVVAIAIAVVVVIFSLYFFLSILWKYFPFELLMTIDWYICMYWLVSERTMDVVDTIPFFVVLIVNWQLLVY